MECDLCDGPHDLADCPEVAEMVDDLTEEADGTMRLECQALEAERFTVGRGFNRETGALMANLILLEEDGEGIVMAFALDEEATDKLVKQMLTVARLLWQTVYVYTDPDEGDDD
jgi:hypothetical protein